jgi:hypothetical protein
MYKHMHVRPVPPKVKPLALRSLRSNILLDEKRDIGTADSAFTSPITSSDVRNHELVCIGTDVSSAFITCEYRSHGMPRKRK